MEVWAVAEASLTLCHPMASCLTPQTTLPADEAESGEVPLPGAYLCEPPPIPQGTGLPGLEQGCVGHLAQEEPIPSTSPCHALLLRWLLWSSEACFLACPLGHGKGRRNAVWRDVASTGVIMTGTGQLESP